MSLKGKLEAIIYAAEEPVTVDQMAVLLRDDRRSPNSPNEASNAAIVAADRPEAAAEDQSATDPTVEATIEATGESRTKTPRPKPASKKKAQRIPS